MQYTLLFILWMCQKSIASDGVTASSDTNECKITENTIEVNDGVPYYEYYQRQYIQRKKLVIIDSSAECEGVSLISDMQLFLFKKPYNLQSIVFRRSNLSLIPTGIFDTFSNLSILYMNKNYVKTIHPGAFTGLTSLKKLHLEDNKLNKISRGVLNSLSSVQALYLQNNSIAEIEEYAFTGLSSLEFLYISNNNLQYILPTCLDQLKMLKEIDFSHNFLQQFEINPIPSLEQCDISFNLLNSLNFSIFSKNLIALKLQNNQINIITPGSNYTIERIDVSHNDLSNVFYVGNDVTYLDLSENNITLLNNSMYSHAERLETLYLSYNFITSFTSEFSGALLALKYLYFKKNYISILPIGCFRNLKELLVLDLSYNQLSEIDYGTFSNMERLQQLDLSNNKIYYLYESSLYRLPNLTDLLLQNNCLNHLYPHDLRMNLKSLNRIQLEGNDWTCKVLSKLVTDLTNLDISVTSGSTKTTSNIHGIACKSSGKTTPHNSDINKELLNYDVPTSSGVMTLKKYFDDDFFSSNLYRYLEKWKNSSKANETNALANVVPIPMLNNFYENLNEDFSKSEFFKFFNSTLQERISSAMAVIDTDRSNFTINNFQFKLKSLVEPLENLIPVLLNRFDSGLEKLSNLSDTVQKLIDNNISIGNSRTFYKEEESTARFSVGIAGKSIGYDKTNISLPGYSEKLQKEQSTRSITDMLSMITHSIILFAILVVMSLLYIRINRAKVLHKQTFIKRDGLNTSDTHLELM